jgi:hypothetical protein
VKDPRGTAVALALRVFGETTNPRGTAIRGCVCCTTNEGAEVPRNTRGSNRLPPIAPRLNELAATTVQARAGLYPR